MWQLGGFELRRDHLVGHPGEAIDAGNLIFTLTEATVQEQKSGTWQVVVTGTVSNPNDDALAPITGDLGNLAVLRSPGTTPAMLESVELGGTWRRDVVAPGGRPVSLAAAFTFPADSEFADTISCGIFTMENTDNSVLGVADGATQWNVDSTAAYHVVTLPLTVLPPQD